RVPEGPAPAPQPRPDFAPPRPQRVAAPRRVNGCRPPPPAGHALPRPQPQETRMEPRPQPAPRMEPRPALPAPRMEPRPQPAPHVEAPRPSNPPPQGGRQERQRR
ncbi:DUF6600 domain-containing protein, partial [Burkholderia cenocepacia]